MRKVLSVASECVPLIKTGGLADVAGALPAALAGRGWDMRVLVPAYRGLIDDAGVTQTLWETDDLFGGAAKILGGAGPLMLLDAPHLFDRSGGPYGNPNDFPDNPLRFAALSKAAAVVADAGLVDGWKPEVLHAHDWQAGLAPAYLHYAQSDVKSVMTIHNIAFQGLAPAALLGALELPIEAFTRDALEYWGQISTLKAGIVYANKITTVSPTYAEELMRGEFGMGLEGLLAHRATDLSGILNGIDDSVWNPASDPLVTPYSDTALKGKKTNRAALVAEFGLSQADGPLAIVVSRLTQQKGMDLLVEAAPDFLARGGQLAILGSGAPEIEHDLKQLVKAHPGQVGLRIGYDEALSHRMFAGGDAVLVPSRFEPCGLTQMYGLRYGTVPVVALTGGLADTVIPTNAVGYGVATGFQFAPVDGLALMQTLRRVIAAFADKKGWTALQKRGMKQQLGWGPSSARYADLYESL